VTYDTDELIAILTAQRNQALDQWAVASAVGRQLEKEKKALEDELAALKAKKAKKGE
jgi:hypothetical protein